VIKAVAEKYNMAQTLIEINDIGGQVADVLHRDLEYENILMCAFRGRAGQTISGGFGGANTHMGVRTTSAVKKLGCSVLKSLLEQDKMIVEDLEIVNELITFVAKGQSYEADEGHNDDLVMTLVLFAWLTRQDYFKDLTNTDVRLDVYEDEIKRLEDEVIPFGIITSTDTETGGVWDGEDRWFP